MTHWQNCPMRIRLLIGRAPLLAKQDTPQRLRELLRGAQILTTFCRDERGAIRRRDIFFRQ
ncbi:MAG: hypothetical protein ACLTSZ_04625 [Lachnospiraceae bacterium]